MRRFLMVAMGVLWFALPANAQFQYLRPDSAKIQGAVDAGVALVHWVETIWGNEDHIVYVRNVSDRPIRVVSFEVYDCVNVHRRSCGARSPGLLLKPGQTKRLAVVRPGTYPFDSGYRYRVRGEYADSAAGEVQAR